MVCYNTFSIGLKADPRTQATRQTSQHKKTRIKRLSHHGGGSSGFVLPVSRKLTSGTVVPRKTVDAALNKNQTKLGVLILTIALQMLTHGNSFLDKHVQILGDLGSKSVSLEDTHDLLSGDGVDLCNAMGVTEDDTDLTGGETLLGKLADVLLNVGGGDLAPTGWGAFVGLGTLRDTLSWCVHASHAVVEEEGMCVQLESMFMKGEKEGATIVRKVASMICISVVINQSSSALAFSY
jgi:hypothetical protein